MKSIWTALQTTAEVERCLNGLLAKSEKLNEFSLIPHNFRKKQSMWSRLSYKKQMQSTRNWMKKLREFVDYAKWCGIKFTVAGLQNLEHEDIVQLKHYVKAKTTPKYLARLNIHQTVRGIGSYSLDSKHFMLYCISIGPEETRRVIAEAKRFKIEPMRRVDGCVFTGKRR